MPVLLWAISGDENPVNFLPDDQAILLARYMVARWGATYGAWFLGGDGDYSAHAPPAGAQLAKGYLAAAATSLSSCHPRARAGSSRSFAMKNG